MAYDRRHLHLTFGGPLAGVESWSTGLRYAKLGEGPQSTTDDLAAVNFTQWWAYIVEWFLSGNTGAQIGSLAQLSWAKLALVDVEGHYVTEPRIMSAAAQTPGVTTTLAPQDCYVVSLRSGQALGKANKGRMYIPVPTWAPGQNGGRAQSGQVAYARTAMRLLINRGMDITRAVNDDYRAVIMSREGAGSTKMITQIGVGEALDTQRRRRSSIPENLVLVSL